ncbi:type IV pilus modification protein PilV [Polaromonas jejuensis]|uniref:Type IV pilus modification protein PilV n=1 Tax=Polaromonas jejuensis TaxID=457502 RepID=A0ABW0QI18_9BURK|nr:type IV pilus modification protein PilV [Polaromonas jejuensis]
MTTSASRSLGFTLIELLVPIATAAILAAPPRATPIRSPLSHRVQSGFSILEVLIAIIILSIGMLGAVGMQTAAMQSNKEARNQAAAATFARELAEKMRGNHTVAIKTAPADNPYLFDLTLTGTPLALPATNCFTDGCPTVKDAAIWDVADWQGRVQTALPTPRVKVCFDQDPFDGTGKPRWACTGTGDIAVLKMGWTRNNTAGTLEFAATSGVPVVVVPLTAGSSE